MAVRLAVYMHQVGQSEEADLVERTEFWLRLQASFDAHEAATRLKNEVKKIKPSPHPEDATAE
jgi:plasmid maintenance system antidote protein VapI